MISASLQSPLSSLPPPSFSHLPHHPSPPHPTPPLCTDAVAGVTYDTVSGVQLPTRQKADDDIILSNYDVVGEDENLKARKHGSSSTLATYYDDVILPKYDVITRDGDGRKEVKWKPPSSPLSSSGRSEPKMAVLEYSMVIAKDAGRVVRGSEGSEYNKLVHNTGEPTPNYSKLQNR